MEELQEKSLARESARVEIAIPATKFSSLDDALKLAIRSAADKKALDIVGLDLRDIASFTEHFVIATGTNQRQVQAIADEISERLKKELGLRAVRIEGYNTGEWVLLDYGDFVFHIFNETSREFYDLERLWRDARKIEIPDDL
ncbi:MAG: ribosome silencing factor [Acidobacteria bacterium ACB1]|nr:Ribosomal silencing factor RsfS [Pyrinomonadaceae bacterium]MCE7961857.1 ribosome silencing factor [Acidobacteria bacterium ACB1]RIJ89086.1 MAG: ribosome silencing factor [Acidobacteriota bacterium]